MKVSFNCTICLVPAFLRLMFPVMLLLIMVCLDMLHK